MNLHSVFLHTSNTSIYKTRQIFWGRKFYKCNLPLKATLIQCTVILLVHIIIIIMCVRDYVWNTFGISSEWFELKFSCNPKVNNKTNMTTGSDFWSDRTRIYAERVCIRERDRKKIWKSITTSPVKYNSVVSGDGVTAVTLLLSRVHNKLISRHASHENIRKVFVCVYMKSTMA